MNRGGRRRRLLPAGRAASAARRVRRGRGGLPGGEPAGAGAAPGPGPAAAGRRASADAAAAATPAGWSARRPTRCRRVRLLPAYVEIMLAAGDVERARATPARSSARSRATTTARCCGAMAATRAGAVALADGDARAALVALRQRRRGVAGARRALRGRARPGAGRAGLPRARRRGVGRARAGGGARRCSRGCGAAPDLARLDSLTRSAAGRPHGLTARELRGAAPGRRRRDQQGDRRRARAQRAHRRPPREQHPHQAAGRLAGGRHRLTRTSTSWSDALGETTHAAARRSWVVSPMRCGAARSLESPPWRRREQSETRSRRPAAGRDPARGARGAGWPASPRACSRAATARRWCCSTARAGAPPTGCACSRS